MNDQEFPRLISQQLTYLHAEPTTYDKPVEGQRSIMISLATVQGEVDRAISFALNDAKRLVVGVLRSLAYHDDNRAQAILDQYFPNTGVGCGDWITRPNATKSTAPQIIQPQPAITCDAPTFKEMTRPDRSQRIMVRVHAQNEYVQYQLQVDGALRWDQSVLLLCSSTLNPEQRLTLKYLIPSTNLEVPSDDEKIDPMAWAMLVNLPPGRTVRRGKKVWIRVGKQQIRRLLANKIFSLPTDPHREDDESTDISSSSASPLSPCSDSCEFQCDEISNSPVEEPSVSNDPMRAGQSVWMLVREKWKRKIGKLEVVGGFARGPHLLLMCIGHGPDGSEHGYIYQLHIGSLRLWAPRKLPFSSSDWEAYVQYKPRATINCGQYRWTKLSQGRIQQLLNNNVCVLS